MKEATKLELEQAATIIAFMMCKPHTNYPPSVLAGWIGDGMREYLDSGLSLNDWLSKQSVEFDDVMDDLIGNFRRASEPQT